MTKSANIRGEGKQTVEEKNHQRTDYNRWGRKKEKESEQAARRRDNNKNLGKEKGDGWARTHSLPIVGRNL